mgnify:FL=1
MINICFLDFLWNSWSNFPSSYLTRKQAELVPELVLSLFIPCLSIIFLVWFFSVKETILHRNIFR